MEEELKQNKLQRLADPGEHPGQLVDEHEHQLTGQRCSETQPSAASGGTGQGGGTPQQDLSPQSPEAATLAPLGSQNRPLPPFSNALIGPETPSVFQPLLSILDEEHRAAINSGMTPEAARFLTEVRSLQLVAYFASDQPLHGNQQEAPNQAGLSPPAQLEIDMLERPAKDASEPDLATPDRTDLQQEVQRLIRNSSRLDAIVSFVLGPVMSLQPGSDLQSGYASDGLAFLAQALDAERGEPGIRPALHRLAAGWVLAQ